MHCGYCGIKDSKCLEKAPDALTESSVDHQIANFLYNSCSHSPQIDAPPFESLFAQLKEIKKLIAVQQQSISNLENYYEEQKRQLLDAIDSYVTSNEHQLVLKTEVIKNFNSNFERLADIQVDARYQQRLQKNVQNYFDKQELDRWTDKCDKTVAKIQKKLVAIKNELREEEVDSTFKQEIGSIAPSILPDKTKLDLADMNFMVIEGRQEERIEADVAKVKALKDFYTDTHRNNMQYIRGLHDVVTRSLGAYRKKFQRTRVLLNDIIANFRNDIKVIDVFSDFEKVFNECLSEMGHREKFKFVYKRVLDMLNELTGQENERRLKFLKKYSSKIPYQIFPNLKSMCKQINLKKFYENFEDDGCSESEVDSKVVARLQDIERSVLQL